MIMKAYFQELESIFTMQVKIYVKLEWTIYIPETTEILQIVLYFLCLRFISVLKVLCNVLLMFYVNDYVVLWILW